MNDSNSTKISQNVIEKFDNNCYSRKCDSSKDSGDLSKSIHSMKNSPKALNKPIINTIELKKYIRSNSRFKYNNTRTRDCSPKAN